MSYPPNGTTPDPDAIRKNAKARLKANLPKVTGKQRSNLGPGTLTKEEPPEGTPQDPLQMAVRRQAERIPEATVRRRGFGS